MLGTRPGLSGWTRLEEVPDHFRRRELLARLADQHRRQVERASSRGLTAIPNDVDLCPHAARTIRIPPDLDRRAILLVSIQGRHGWIALVAVPPQVKRDRFLGRNDLPSLRPPEKPDHA